MGPFSIALAIFDTRYETANSITNDSLKSKLKFALKKHLFFKNVNNSELSSSQFLRKMKTNWAIVVDIFRIPFFMNRNDFSCFKFF